MKKIVSQQVVQHTDFETGEVHSETKSSVVRFPTEPPYVKLYIEDLCSLIGVQESDQALLRHLLARLDYEGYVALTSRSRESISRALGITSKTLRNRLNRLVKADLIKPVARNEYQINPNYFARGDWKRVCEQREAYRMVVTYTESGRKVTTETAGDTHLQAELPV